MEQQTGSLCTIVLACMCMVACATADEADPPMEATATEQASYSGNCDCAVTVDVYDDSCGAACGYLGTTSYYTVRQRMGSTYACIQWCQQVAWNTGHQTCHNYSPNSRSVVLDWSGRWGFDPYFFYNQQYACSDL